MDSKKFMILILLSPQKYSKGARIKDGKPCITHIQTSLEKYISNKGTSNYIQMLIVEILIQLSKNC